MTLILLPVLVGIQMFCQYAFEFLSPGSGASWSSVIGVVAAVHGGTLLSIGLLHAFYDWRSSNKVLRSFKSWQEKTKSLPSWRPLPGRRIEISNLPESYYFDKGMHVRNRVKAVRSLFGWGLILSDIYGGKILAESIMPNDSADADLMTDIKSRFGLPEGHGGLHCVLGSVASMAWSAERGTTATIRLDKEVKEVKDKTEHDEAYCQPSKSGMLLMNICVDHISEGDKLAVRQFDNPDGSKSANVYSFRKGWHLAHGGGGVAAGVRYKPNSMVSSNTIAMERLQGEKSFIGKVSKIENISDEKKTSLVYLDGLCADSFTDLPGDLDKSTWDACCASYSKRIFLGVSGIHLNSARIGDRVKIYKSIRKDHEQSIRCIINMRTSMYTCSRPIEPFLEPNEELVRRLNASGTLSVYGVVIGKVWDDEDGVRHDSFIENVPRWCGHGAMIIEIDPSG